MDEMRIIECEQGTPEWFAARAGIPTASEFSTVMAKGEGKTRRTYMLKLAGEILTGEPMESYSNGHMERGKEWEAEAREKYAFDNDVEPETIGFIRRGNMGCSPDSLIGSVGLLEIKTKLPHLQIECILKDAFPPEHKAQTQGQLLVADREWIDLSVYSRKLPPFVKRAVRDEPYLANMKGEIDRFNDELAALVEQVRRYGQPQLEVAA